MGLYSTFLPNLFYHFPITFEERKTDFSVPVYGWKMEVQKGSAVYSGSRWVAGQTRFGIHWKSTVLSSPWTVERCLTNPRFGRQMFILSFLLPDSLPVIHNGLCARGWLTLQSQVASFRQLSFQLTLGLWWSHWQKKRKKSKDSQLPDSVEELESCSFQQPFLMYTFCMGIQQPFATWSRFLPPPEIQPPPSPAHTHIQV